MLRPPDIAAVTPRNGIDGRCVRGGLKMRVSGTRVEQLSASPPVHAGRPYRDGKALVLQLATPTGALLPGDQMRVEAEVHGGGQLVLSSPAATRIQPGVSDEFAEIRQTLTVKGEGSWLELAPLGTLLQTGSRLDQDTRLRISEGGSALLWDVLWPGRLAREEAYTFTECRSRLRIEDARGPLASERMCLRPENRQGRSLRRAFARPSVLGSVFLLTAQPLKGLAEAIHALQEPETFWIGASPLVRNGIAIRLLSCCSRTLHQKLAELRRLLYRFVEVPMPDLRRL